MKKKTLVLTAALSLSLSMGTTAFAAPVAVGDSGVFDADYYADNNQDVEAVCGRDFNLLWQHYTTFGVNEGRLPFAPNTDWQAVLAIANTTTTNTEATQQTQTEQTQTEQTQTTVTPTVSTSDFLAQNGLSVTPQGTVGFSYLNTDYDELDGSEPVIPTIVSVTDVTSSQAGYTDTIAQFIYTAHVKPEITTSTDTTGIGSGVSTAGKWYESWNVEVFDKSTGTVLQSYQGSAIFANDSYKQDYNEKQGSSALYDCTVSITTAEMMTEAEFDDGVLTTTVTVHHPSSYDGVAFLYGTGGMRVKEEKDAVAGTSFTILNTPYALANAKIFTATNN